MLILDGTSLAAKFKGKIEDEVNALIKKGTTPSLHILLANADDASAIYVRNKLNTCEKLSIRAKLHKFNPESITQEDILQKISLLNVDENVHGILCQLPLPKHINADMVAAAIAPKKDVDCFNPFNIGQLFNEETLLEPCTPKAIIALLHHYQIDLTGKRVVIIGRSKIVGKPLALMLLRKQNNATVTVCHSRSKNLKEICLSADVLIPALGKANFLNEDYIKPEAVVVDVGISKIRVGDKNKTCGDVDFNRVKDLVFAISKVPGGVGPMTIHMLIDNLVKTTKMQTQK
ncbi:MAG: bifunctional methylenetetrahydrofolate dehydrogenase/methenyltetrahydrofolate cyclohydrolase [SAR324 cluster bacterium]|nr:bifunctional methylenetetrahydrofolate dehydrogenase/methenyltetrahydrofolate cyclohydrolase [SAR324 cluster bacterium]